MRSCWEGTGSGILDASLRTSATLPEHQIQRIAYESASRASWELCRNAITCSHIFQRHRDGSFVIERAVKTDEGIASSIAHHQDLLHHLLSLLHLKYVDHFQGKHFVGALPVSFPNVSTGTLPNDLHQLKVRMVQFISNFIASVQSFDTCAASRAFWRRNQGVNSCSSRWLARCRHGTPLSRYVQKSISKAETKRQFTISKTESKDLRSHTSHCHSG
jgi:hypothetical protein